MQGKKSTKRKEQDQFDWLAVEAGVDGEQAVKTVLLQLHRNVRFTASSSAPFRSR